MLAALATWRLTHLLAFEDGPADVIVRVRRRLGAGWMGALMDCFYCLSLWVAAPFAATVVRQVDHPMVTWLALSGAACALENLSGTASLAPSQQDQHEGEDRGVLWPEA